MKVPVKDRKTVPWMSSTEIPAVKLVLSEWRKLRRSVFWRESVSCDPSDIPSYVVDAASILQSISLAERELKKETDKCLRRGSSRRRRTNERQRL